MKIDLEPTSAILSQHPCCSVLIFSGGGKDYPGKSKYLCNLLGEIICYLRNGL